MASYGCLARKAFPLHEHVAVRRALLSGEHREQLVLALSLERCDPEDLAGVQGEGDVGERLAHPHAANLECRRRVGRELDPLAVRCRLGALGSACDLCAEHELDDLLLAPFAGHERADVAAVPEDGRAIAVCDHLAQAVRDEQGRAPALLLRLHHREDPLGEIRGQRGGDLVEDQELRIARERTREVEHPLHRQRHVQHLLGEVDVEIEVAQVPSHRLDGRAREPKVLRDGQVGHERGILEDGRQSDAHRLRRRGDACLGAVHKNRAGVRPDHAGQHLDERALARTVRSEQGVDLARFDDERRRSKRDHRSVALRHLACGQKAHRRILRGEAPDRRPSPRGLAYGPLQPVSCAAV